jgi:hypothetical protein
MTPVTERIHESLVRLQMAHATLETLDQTLSRLEKDEIRAIEATSSLRNGQT